MHVLPQVKAGLSVVEGHQALGGQEYPRSQTGRLRVHVHLALGDPEQAHHCHGLLTSPDGGVAVVFSHQTIRSSSATRQGAGKFMLRGPTHGANPPGGKWLGGSPMRVRGSGGSGAAVDDCIGRRAAQADSTQVDLVSGFSREVTGVGHRGRGSGGVSYGRPIGRRHLTDEAELPLSATDQRGKESCRGRPCRSRSPRGQPPGRSRAEPAVRGGPR